MIRFVGETLNDEKQYICSLKVSPHNIVNYKEKKPVTSQWRNVAETKVAKASITVRKHINTMSSREKHKLKGLILPDEIKRFSSPPFN